MTPGDGPDHAGLLAGRRPRPDRAARETGNGSRRCDPGSTVMVWPRKPRMPACEYGRAGAHGAVVDEELRGDAVGGVDDEVGAGEEARQGRLVEADGVRPRSPPPGTRGAQPRRRPTRPSASPIDASVVSDWRWRLDSSTRSGSSRRRACRLRQRPASAPPGNPVRRRRRPVPAPPPGAPSRCVPSLVGSFAPTKKPLPTGQRPERVSRSRLISPGSVSPGWI